MDLLAKYRQQLAFRIFAVVIVTAGLSIATMYACISVFSVEPALALILGASVAILGAMIMTSILTSAASKPFEKLVEVVMYAAHSERGGAAPETTKLSLARELVENMSREIYSLGSQTPRGNVQTTTHATQQPLDSTSTQILIDAIPLPVIGFDAQQTVMVANKAAADYVDKPLAEIVGKPLYDSYKLSFQSEIGLEEWLRDARSNSVTSNTSWDRVRHLIDQDNWKQFDLVASFSSGSSSGTETMLAIFDRSEQYNLDDQEIGYVALAVHELRTPLTIMRGYIEVFQDELGPSLSPELKDFMHKMQASAEQLTAFVSNILNVARVEENQLTLKLRSEDIGEIINNAVSDLQLRAKVHGKNINVSIADGLPAVGVDKISIHEVLNNLVDNAIKYSDKAEQIDIIAHLNSDGVVEVSVKDYGIGIPSSVIGQLFQKFHRSHKSRVQVGGTGLGLYLCKALVKAHGGNIWVRSKEGEGSIFSFTVLPYDQVSHEQNENEDGIIRGAHGWIKNHSLYRN